MYCTFVQFTVRGEILESILKERWPLQSYDTFLNTMDLEKSRAGQSGVIIRTLSVMLEKCFEAFATSKSMVSE